MPFVPSRAIEELGPDFYDPVAPARFPEHRLRFRNDRAAAEVGLDGLDEAEWVARFGCFEPFEGGLPQPLALRYHGHQFRHYNPDIGDGRGFLYAQCLGPGGRLMDFGTKGSGQTPWSRFGDGRLTLKGGVREVLATEMLEALGVVTSRSLSLIETGEALERGDEPSPTRSSVLVRLSHGHIRIGTFQRLAYLDEGANLERLVDYVLAHLARLEAGEGAAARLLDWVAGGTARLAASYMAAGFVHGVLNSDNINVTGESFDYGPWRWLPQWDPGFTAAYFDHMGLYAFSRQPEAIQWDLLQLARSLVGVSSSEALLPVLQGFPPRYEAELTRAMLGRLGVEPRGDAANLELLQAMEAGLRETRVPLDRFWFDWRGGALRRPSAAYDAPAFHAFRSAVAGFAAAGGALDHPYWEGDEPCAMLIEEVEAIWSAIADGDDWGPFEAKVAAVRRMGEAHALTARASAAAPPA